MNGKNSGIAAAVLMAGMCTVTARANITIDTVHVGDAGNAPDTRYSAPGYGAVNHEYNIGTYEVTAGQYAAFLNAVAAVDTYTLYNPNMADTQLGSGISRSGTGTLGDPYSYTVDADSINRPVNYVSWGDAARFANWLHHGQPTGAQDATTTERGSYTLDGATTNSALLAVTRSAGATWVIPAEDEWYKAAYYNPATDSYYSYPTSSDSIPGRDLADASGNNANYVDVGSPSSPIDPPHGTTVVGEFQNSASPYGTFDQGGNV